MQPLLWDDSPPIKRVREVSAEGRGLRRIILDENAYMGWKNPRNAAGSCTTGVKHTGVKHNGSGDDGPNHR